MVFVGFAYESCGSFFDGGEFRGRAAFDFEGLLTDTFCVVVGVVGLVFEFVSVGYSDNWTSVSFMFFEFIVRVYAHEAYFNFVIVIVFDFHCFV